MTVQQSKKMAFVSRLPLFVLNKSILKLIISHLFNALAITMKSVFIKNQQRYDCGREFFQVSKLRLKRH